MRRRKCPARAHAIGGALGAEAFPSRTISITVPFSAGGPTDTIARIVAERLSRSLGKPVIVENVAGAGGTIGVAKVLQSKADGHSIIIGHVGTHVIAPAVQQIQNALPQVRAGRVKAIAVTSRTRLASAPDIPTTDEAGLPGFYMSVWHALWVPKGTPKEAIDKLGGAVREALADPVVRKRLADLGQEIPPVEQQSPEGLRAFHKAENDKWVPVIRKANITAQ